MKRSTKLLITYTAQGIFIGLGLDYLFRSNGVDLGGWITFGIGISMVMASFENYPCLDCLNYRKNEKNKRT